VVRRLVPEIALGADDRPVAVWAPDTPFLAVSSAVLGGGIGPRAWVLHATVGEHYHHPAPAEHLAELAAGLGLGGPGIGLLTAVDVRRAAWRADGGVEALVTVGLGWPTWAADDEARSPIDGAGTINIVVWVPARLSDAALVNAVGTATESKAQALVELGVAGTGTASDALAICCPLDGDPAPYGGPRSQWGASLARAVHAAVREGGAADRSHTLP
jgi:adenosylcobinamide amidohydrolase